MAIFDGNTPYTNLHELNLDWVIKKVAELKKQNDSVIEQAESIIANAEQYSESAEQSATEAQESATNAQTYANQAYDATVGLSQSVATLDARMDTFTQLARGSTTGDAELQDIRVEYDGVTATTRGNAVRQQVSDLWSATLRLYPSATDLKTTYNNVTANINKNLIFSADTEWTDLPKTNANILTGGIFINIRYSASYNLNLLITSSNGLVFKRIVTRSSHAIYSDWVNVGIQPIAENLTGSNARTVCLSDFNNLANNLIYCVSITQADASSVANLPTKGKLCRGLLITSGKQYKRANTDTQLFFPQYGQYVAFRTYWSSAGGWTEWNYLGTKPYSVLCVGDSIAYGGRNNHLGFIGQFHYPVTTNASEVGASISTVRESAKNVPQQLIDSYSADTNYDIVIAEGGINDYLSNAVLGSVPTAPVTDDTGDNRLDKSTIVGSIQHLFYNMIKLYPNAQKFFVITHRTLTYPYTNNTAGYTQTDMHDLIVETAKLYGIHIIDIFNESNINSAFSQYISPVPYSDDNTVTDLYWLDNDGVHPLAYGYLHGYVPFIRQALELGTVK